MKINFDKTECSRCGGSGHFSYNAMDGTRCYGCSGSGKKFTRLGRKAYDVFVASLTITVDELKVGDVVMVATMGPTVKRVVLSISIGKSYSVTRDADGNEVRNYHTDIKYKDITCGLFSTNPIRLAFTADKRERVLAALKGMKGYSIEETEVS